MPRGFREPDKDQVLRHAKKVQALLWQLSAGYREAKKIKGPQIVQLCGIQNETYLRSAVHHLRTQGVAVLADAGGYWLSDNPEEIAECILSLEERAGSIMQAVKGLRSAHKTLTDTEPELF